MIRNLIPLTLSRLVVTLLPVAMCMLTGLARGGDEAWLLTPAEVSRLNDAALAEYNLAVQSIDRVDRVGAIEALERASSAQPGHAELAFFLARLAGTQGQREYGDEARRYMLLAQKSVDRVLTRSDISLDPLTLDRAEAGSRLIKQELDKLGERDDRRMATGLAINLEIATDYSIDPEAVTGRPAKIGSDDPTSPFSLMALSLTARSNAAAAAAAEAAAEAAAARARAVAQPGAGFAAPQGGPTGFGAPGGGPSPFGAPGGGPSPFGAPGGAPSPFGAPAGGSPFGAPAGGSPFGAPSTSPFGAPSASPFGAPAGGGGGGAYPGTAPMGNDGK